MELPISTPIIALIAVQIVLQVIALVHLLKTPAGRVSLGGRKWLWALIIIIAELLGPIMWFLLGRKPVQEEITASETDLESKRGAVDALYGAPKE